jgi:hypothetical protein
MLNNLKGKIGNRFSGKYGSITRSGQMTYFDSVLLNA